MSRFTSDCIGQEATGTLLAMSDNDRVRWRRHERQAYSTSPAPTWKCCSLNNICQIPSAEPICQAWSHADLGIIRRCPRNCGQSVPRECVGLTLSQRDVGIAGFTIHTNYNFSYIFESSAIFHMHSDGSGTFWGLLHFDWAHLFCATLDRIPCVA
ncbi:hypothetical protein CONLIGDRAFT_191378 [Coniochaeta ligniaria NRRL 30616]|uniref:Uncharacterized protein n=1 Tax=Coniochaeta ligniaria NRRL 30616 TaxID=1408157 RepID=A0A1J7JUR3_9PEZI|nr:hypothetical protein CONLIGDRAFT_191378 [Coniochaeta ligniaria NRRL 30616]